MGVTLSTVIRLVTRAVQVAAVAVVVAARIITVATYVATSNLGQPHLALTTVVVQAVAVVVILLFQNTRVATGRKRKDLTMAQNLST